MTRIFISLSLLVGFTAGSASAVDLGVGLTLFSPMDDTTSSTFAGYWEDASGNDYHVNNVAAPAYNGGGARSTAVECDASLSTIMTVYDGFESTLDPGLDDYSVSCWAYQTTEGIAWILDKGAYVSGQKPGFSFISINGTPSFRVMGEGGTKTEQLTLQDTSVDLTDGWHHLTGVIDRTGAYHTANTANFYVDGILAQSAAIPDVDSQPANLSTTDPFLMGGRSTTTLNYGGYLDDVALYRGALSPTDVQTLYNATSLETSTISSAGITPLVLHNFEGMVPGGGSPGVVPDVISANNGALFGAEAVTDATRGEVIEYDSTDTHGLPRVDYGDAGNPGTGNQTVSVWFRLDELPEDAATIVSKGNTAWDFIVGWSVFVSSRQGCDIFVRADFNGTMKAATWKPTTLDEWHHLAFVIDNENGIVKGYLDGQSSGEDGTENGWDVGRGGATSVTFTPESDLSTDVNLLLGRDIQSVSPFTGLIDDFAIWDRVLSDGEILALYNGVAPGDTFNYIPGDADGDSDVDGDDAAILASNWLASGVGWGGGDFNEDGVVDDIDATLLAANWTDSLPASVPEPGMLGVIFIGFFVSLLCSNFSRKRRLR